MSTFWRMAKVSLLLVRNTWYVNLIDPYMDLSRLLGVGTSVLTLPSNRLTLGRIRLSLVFTRSLNREQVDVFNLNSKLVEEQLSTVCIRIPL